METRPRQNECLDNIRNEYIAGVYQQLVVAATGVGKAVIVANVKRKMADLLPGKMLVFAHRQELIDQLVVTMQEWNPDLKVGKEMGDVYADENCDIVVSCVASIGRDACTRLRRFGSFDIVVCDEAHHSIASTYLNVFEQTGVLKKDSHKLLVGFTATPKRKNIIRKKKDITLLETDDEDIIQLSSVYKKIVFKYPLRKAIKEGWLVPLRGYTVKTKVDLSKIKTVAGDYDPDDLSLAVNTPERNYAIVEQYLKHCEQRQTVAFCVDIKHVQDLAAMFRLHGVKSEAIWGEDPERSDYSRCDSCKRYRMPEAKGKKCNKNYGTPEIPERCQGTMEFGKGKLTRHVEKEITVLCNAQLLTEGYDDWQVSCIIDAAPTKSATKYTQCIGRGTRLQTATGNLLEALAKGYALTKRDCIVIDVVDNNKRCSLVTLPSLCGLNPDLDLQGASVTAAADKIEELQEQYPTLDLTQLTDYSKVDAYIESMDLFAEPYTEDVKEFSLLSWMACSDGSYLLQIPEKKDLKGMFSAYKHEKLHITPNELDEFVLSISAVGVDKELGNYSTLKEAFTSADEVMQRCRPDRMKLVTREAEWHTYPASEPAKKLLRSLSKGKNLLKCVCPNPTLKTLPLLCPLCRCATGITAGEASAAINLLKARKK